MRGTIMNLAQWSPLRELEDIFNIYNYNPTWSKNKTSNGELTIPDWSPKVDVKENKDNYFIKAELPGVDKKDVKVTLEKGILSIRGEKRFEKEYEDEKSHRVECSYGNFVRSFSLPESVDHEGVSAKFKDGLLHLCIKKAQTSKQKTIEINVD